MNCRTKAMTISLLLHGAALSLVFALSSSLAKQEKPIVIDFTVIEPSSPAAQPAKTPQKKMETPASAKTITQSTPRKLKVTPPAPAVEPEGPVPIVAKPRESLPLAPVQTAAGTALSGAPGGMGTSPTSRTSGMGQGDSAEQLSSRYRAENFAFIKKIIEENLSYPDRAQRLGWSGRVVVSFNVTQNGQVRDIKIMTSTGYELLDSNVIDTIKKVAPFPRPPIAVKLTIPFTYSLR